MDVLRDVINIDPEILGGAPVFTGTRVNIETLIWHLEAGISLDEMLDDFPTASKDQVIAALHIANRFLAAKNLPELYAAIID